MTYTELFIDALHGSGRRMKYTRTRYERLTDDQRANVETLIRRHLRACRSVGVKPDIGFVLEAIDDELKGLNCLTS